MKPRGNEKNVIQPKVNSNSTIIIIKHPYATFNEMKSN